MKEDYATITAEVLAETDAFGTNSHGTKNLYGYIKKARVGGVDLKAEPEIVREGAACAVIDAHNALGMVGSWMGMSHAIEKAKKAGIALVTVKNSCISARRGITPTWRRGRDLSAFRCRTSTRI